MNALGIRSVTASALSLWLGVLACLLGCATPTRAMPTHQVGAICPKGSSDAGDSCCQNHNPGSSEKNRHHAMSCCPTETALTQKQIVISHALTSVFVAVLMVSLDASPLFERSHVGGASPWHTGRDILQRVHILRI
jgi:hypothetical protein